MHMERVQVQKMLLVIILEDLMQMDLKLEVKVLMDLEQLTREGMVKELLESIYKGLKSKN